MGKKIRINLQDATQAKKFLRVVKGFESDVDIMTGTAVCDAKSVLGVFALNLAQDTYVRIISDDERECEKFRKEMEAFQ